MWDADMMYGCKCRKGRHGYDCSKRSCPRGDDPLTGNQVNEVQVLRCTGKGGYFLLYFNGEGARVPFDASEAQLAVALRSIKTLPIVKVTYTVPGTVCSSAAMNAVLIEFTDEFGPQPPIKVLGVVSGTPILTGGDVFAASGGAVMAGRISTRGNKEWEFCSNRGDCDEETGVCNCYLVPMPGYRSSDGYGNVGVRGDCGAANDKNKYGGPIKSFHHFGVCAKKAGRVAIAPGIRSSFCIGHMRMQVHAQKDRRGFVSRQPRTRFTTNGRRAQMLGFVAKLSESADATRHSPGTRASTVSFDFVRGHSNFLVVGLEIWEPACYGHGQCMSIRQLSLEADVDSPLLRFDYGVDPNSAQTYDRDSVLGCKCDPGYEGYDCSQRSCPRGDDPATTGQVDEIQLLKCIATGGTFQLLYRTSFSADIPFDATPSALRDILITSLHFEDVVVEYSVGQLACSPATATTKNVIKVTFPIDHGDLPPLGADTTSSTLSTATPPKGTIVLAENGATIDGFASQTGTRENAVCSNKGICNSELGLCMCTTGYGSNDSQGNQATSFFASSLPIWALHESSCPSMRPDEESADERVSRTRNDSVVGDLPSFSKERQLRHTSVALSLHLNALHIEAESPLRKPSALQLKYQCERDFEKFCESKNRRRRHRLAPAIGGTLEGSLWLEAERANDACARATILTEHTHRLCVQAEELALERLVRRISPGLSNSASSHTELLRILLTCRECSARANFCSVCTAKASEFSSGYTTSELAALYGRDLPPANAEALGAFKQAIADHEFRATHNVE
ncbi:hypothetical protein FI667_g16935, partial [Globisporangium splendens]